MPPLDTFETSAWKKRATPARSSSASHANLAPGRVADRASIPSWPQPWLLRYIAWAPPRSRAVGFPRHAQLASPVFFWPPGYVAPFSGAEFLFPQFIFLLFHAGIPQSGCSWEFPRRVGRAGPATSCRIAQMSPRLISLSPPADSYPPLCWGGAGVPSALAPPRRLASRCGRALPLSMSVFAWSLRRTKTPALSRNS